METLTEISNSFKSNQSKITPCTSPNLCGTSNEVIKVNDLYYRYDKNLVLNGLNFSLQQGKVYGFLGSNGAGKTTLIKCLLGQLTSAKGCIRIFDNDPGSNSVKSRIGTMMQIGGLPSNITVLEHLQLFQSYFKEPLSLTQALTLSGLETCQNKPFSQLSGGQKQRLLFAIALIGDPDLLFLDEPSLAMDVHARRTVYRTIEQLKQQGKTIVLTTHYMEEAEKLADHIFIIKDGSIITQGSPSLLKSTLQESKMSFKTDTPKETLSWAISQCEAQIKAFTFNKNTRHVDITCKDVEVLLASLITNSVHLEQLSVVPISLEQAFLSFTQAGDTV